MVLLTGAVYSQCNKDNWEYYYPDRMQDCNLAGADLKWADLEWAFLKSANLNGVNLTEADLAGVISGDIKGTPKSLPDGWSLVGGVLVNESEGIKDESKDVENEALSLFDNIDNNGNKKISKKEWKLYIEEQQPEIIKDKTAFSSVDRNKNKKISKKEFIIFFKRLKK